MDIGGDLGKWQFDVLDALTAVLQNTFFGHHRQLVEAAIQAVNGKQDTPANPLESQCYDIIWKYGNAAGRDESPSVDDSLLCSSPAELLLQLQSDDTDTRATAICILGLLKQNDDQIAAQALIRATADRKAYIRCVALHSLGILYSHQGTGDDILDVLTESLNNDRSYHGRVAAANALLRCGNSAIVIESLRQSMKSNDEKSVKARAAVIRALTHFGKAAMDTLPQILEYRPSDKQDEVVRLEAILRINADDQELTDDTVGRLTQLLRDDRYFVREAAFHALSEESVDFDVRSALALEVMMVDDSSHLRSEAASWLFSRNPELASAAKEAMNMT